MQVSYRTAPDPLDPANGHTSEHVYVTEGGMSAFHSSYPRGGCLYAGFVTLRNWGTGAEKEIDITSRASDTPEHVSYLLSLAHKHVGAVS